MCASSRSIRDTGCIEIVGFWGVDDVGTVINPMIVEGQIHGGLAQGLGQALLERCAYDGERPARVRIVHGLCDARAPTICRRSSPSATRASPAPTIRSAPRAAARPGSIGAPAAVVSAALDALAGLGVTDLDMPLTPEQIWRRIGEAARANGAPAGRA